MKKYTNTWLLASLLILSSCGKSFLDVKRNASQVVPKTIADYQAILDWNTVMNQTASFSLVCLGSDEYYLTDEVWNALSGLYVYQKNGYIWAKNVYEGAEVDDWSWAYQRILYANMALDVEKIRPTPQEQVAWNTVKGQALFFRAWTYYQLAQTFCKFYDETTASTDPGVPIRLDYDVTIKIGRGTLKETYDRILQDLKDAESLLPETVLSNFLPSKRAADALLARIYLELGKYNEANVYSSKVLSNYTQLMDYNLLDLSKNIVFSDYAYGKGNPEVIFYSHTSSGLALSLNNLNVDSNLYLEYGEMDLRKAVFFNTTRQYTGKYTGVSSLLFTGLAVDEVYLIKAESALRQGNDSEAKATLDTFLSTRYKSGLLPHADYKNYEEIFNAILSERKKELYMRGTRWMDLRRLNRNLLTEKSIIRNIDGKNYTLLPDEKMWVWPLPDNEVLLNGLEQNER